ncbi:putative DNA binding domain-containing protein [bacterium]|nr:putative DNA binding domain-containing protein [bacterium]
MRTEPEIKNEIRLGEDSIRQFKVKLNNPAHVAIEMCAMSNSSGGTIYVGVKDDCTIEGLSSEEVRKYNSWIADAASQLIRPAIYPLTQTVEIDSKLLLLIEVSEGASRPYQDNKGAFWVKSGSDKRVASPQELMRLFQQNSQLTLDEMITSADISEIDQTKFNTFFEQTKGIEFTSVGLKLENVLNNMNLAKDSKLTLGGLLLFGKDVQEIKPYCIIRAICFYGNEISDNSFIDKRDCSGTLDEQFRLGMLFLKNNLSFIQIEPSFNSLGVLEIDERALEEAVVNAILHRDYSKSAVIRLFIFKNRVEIISPGSLPNHLTVENIKNGNSVMRNPLLASYGTKVLPYSGIGSGIPRILKNHPETQFLNDKQGEQFSIILARPARS